MSLNKSDYEEPACPFSRPEHSFSHEKLPETIRRIPLAQIIDECDCFFNSNQMQEVGKHLRYWLEQARKLHDHESELSLLSELMGHYRMQSDPERGLQAVYDGFELMKKLNMAHSASAGTILINGATALQAFGRVDEALQYYAEAFRCYGETLPPDDWRFAGLLNNMASAYSEKNEFKHAEVYYRKALDVLAKCGNFMDRAVTHVNLAQLYHRQDPADERIDRELDLAMKIFDDPAAVRDGYYAHTCLKCLSAFSFLGRFADEEELKERAEKIYERA